MKQIAMACPVCKPNKLRAAVGEFSHLPKRFNPDNIKTGLTPFCEPHMKLIVQAYDWLLPLLVPEFKSYQEEHLRKAKAKTIYHKIAIAEKTGRNDILTKEFCDRWGFPFPVKREDVETIMGHYDARAEISLWKVVEKAKTMDWDLFFLLALAIAKQEMKPEEAAAMYCKNMGVPVAAE